MIQADRDDVVPGFSLRHILASTILDTGDDQGNYLGVSVYVTALFFGAEKFSLVLTQK